MTSIDFDKIVRTTAPRREYQADWTRQRETAKAFLSRFEDGFDTQLLADEVGMGKTYVAMALLGAMLRGKPRSQRRALLITPPSAVLRSKWEQELRSFGDTYLGTEGKKVAPLRPLIVRDYWQLVANLHDYDNDPVGRVSDRRQGSVLNSFWIWCRTNQLLRHPNTNFRANDGYDRNSEAALSFTSEISISGWWAFLDALRAAQEPLVREMASRLQTYEYGDALAWLNGVFREFTAQQSRYVPEVLILGMSGLRRPKLNQWETQRFCTFLLGVLLAGAWKQTRDPIIKALDDENVIVSGMTSEKLKQLERADLYRTRHCVKRVMDKCERLSSEWDRLRVNPDAHAIRAFFRELMDAVILEKIAESGIELAVVDEAHNWKDGNNGGDIFKTVFAPSIRHKLLMSATPFQLAESEMRRVFDRAAMPGSRTQAVLSEIYAPQGVVTQCLAANDRFRKQWDRLADDLDAVSVLHETTTGASAAVMSERIKVLAEDRLANPNVRAMCDEALKYRDAVHKLTDAQRSIVIRHTKSRAHRAFHAGQDFTKIDLQPQRTALYETRGMAENADAFIHYLAMRLDQQLRIRGKSLDTANAHLMGGLTSSKAAFKSSATALKDIPVHVDAVTQGYITMFDNALQHHEHPKVRATVDKALANYRNGRKTLIFCERVDTLKEIEDLLRDGMEKASSSGASGFVERRKTMLEHSELVDMRLMRMLWLCRGASDTDEFSARVAGIQPAAIEFAASTLACIGANVTPRRVHRLMDIWAVSEARGRFAPPKATHTLLAALRDAFHYPHQYDHGLVRSILGAEIGKPADVAAVRKEVLSHAETWFADTINIWEGTDSAAFCGLIWRLLENEADMLLQNDSKPVDVARSFYDTYVALQRGLRKVILRPDLFREYVKDVVLSDRVAIAPEQLANAVYRGIRAPRGEGESPWSRMHRFVSALVEANGSINPHASTNTQRRSLWRGVNIQPTRHGANDDEGEAKVGDDDFAVQTLYGAIKPDRRVVLCAAFNSPLAPDILICTSIGSEGIDLHKECAEVIHHDLPWNPAKLEQRIGRVDRVGSLAETSGQWVRVGMPFQEQSYERFQYSVLLARAQRFQVLLGKPDFELNSLEEESGDDNDGDVKELEADLDATNDEPSPSLPEGFLQWLSVDLSLAR